MYYEEVSDPSYWQYYVLMFVVSTIVLCILLNTMASLAERVSPDVRTLESSQVWISVIPVFGSFWIFNVVIRLANMMRDEFARRKIVEFETSPGLSSGLGFCFTLFTAQISLLFDTPVLAVVLYITAIALLAVYWSKLAAYIRKLDQQHYQSQYQSQSAVGNQQQWPQQQYTPPPPEPPRYVPPGWQNPPSQQSQWQSAESSNQQQQYTPPPQQYQSAENDQSQQPPPPPNEWDRWRPK